MKLATLLESKLVIKVKNLEGKRYFFEATRSKESRNWLNANDDSVICEATVDIINDEAYINRIDSHSRNEGNGSELLAYVIDYMKDKGFKKFRTYIESVNSESRSLFRKQNFKEGDKTPYGSYWIYESV
jgi:ribosomal protein S18 acetylase RimI-like enzyme